MEKYKNADKKSTEALKKLQKSMTYVKNRNRDINDKLYPHIKKKVPINRLQKIGLLKPLATANFKTIQEFYLESSQAYQEKINELKSADLDMTYAARAEFKKQLSAGPNHYDRFKEKMKGY